VEVKLSPKKSRGKAFNEKKESPKGGKTSPELFSSACLVWGGEIRARKKKGLTRIKKPSGRGTRSSGSEEEYIKTERFVKRVAW